MNKLKQLAGQTLIYGISTVLVRALNWLLAPFHSQVFESNPEDFGIVAEMYAYVAFINIVFMYGMETAFFRYASKSKDKANSVFSTSFISLFGSTVFFVGALLLFAPNIASLLGYPGQELLVQLVALIIGFDTLSNIPFAKLRLEGKSLKYVAIKGFNVAVNIVLNVILLYPIISGNLEMFGFSANPSLAVVYIFIANLSASVVTFLVFLPSILSQKIEFSKNTWKDLMRYGTPLIIVGLAGMINETLDRILLKELLPFKTQAERLAQMGIYSMAYKLSIFMSLVVQGFRLGVEPFFFKQAKETDAKDTYAKVMTYFVIVGVLVFLGVSLNLDWIIKILSEPFREGKKIVPIVLMAYLFLGIFYNLSVWYKVTDNTMKATYIAVFGAVVTIVLNVVLIPRIGYVGSAWATFAAYAAMTLTSYLWGRSLYPVPYNLSKLGAYLLLGVAFFWASDLIEFESIVYNLVAKNAILLLYIAIAYHFDLKGLLRTHKS